ncbi:MAG: hypothetical protein K2X61_03040 [Caulobacteraceae bacterium]|nr:hypothetical protein [Caulobacteraceae bacterium]
MVFRFNLAVPIMIVALAAAPVATGAAIQRVPPEADQWRDNRQLAPAVTDPEMRARMNAEIVEAIRDANGDEEAARRAINAIAARYQEAAEAQAARGRPGPK